MLRVGDYSFPDKTASVAAHKSDHDALHSAYNQVTQLDDYATLQDAVDATLNHGTIIIPLGVHTKGGAVIANKSITLQGYDAYIRFADVLGATSWNSAGALTGSILRRTSGDGVFIDATDGRVNLVNVGLWGNGTGTGIKSGNVETPYQGFMRWHNVCIANFVTGMQTDDIYSNLFSAVHARGCTTGIYLHSSNGSLLLNADISACGIGIHLQGGTCTTIQGGTIQGCSDTGVLVEGSEECIISSVYFENVDANYAINTTGVSDRLMLINNHASTPGDKTRMGSNHGVIWLGKYGSANNVSNLILDGNQNLVYVTANHATITNTGTGNIIHRTTSSGMVLTGGGRMIFDGITPVLKSPDGSLWRLTVSNAGALSTVAV